MQRCWWVLILVLFLPLAALSQPDSVAPQKTLKRRQYIFSGTTAFLTTSSLVYLNQAWYKDYNTGRFHFFNDDTEWLQMDKVGHVFTNYQMADLMMKGFEWTGCTRRKKLIYGGGIGFAYMTAIDRMDGFSRGWGFSWGDETANIAGTSLAVMQEIYWKEQKFRLKFSYAESGLAQYNPGLLGKNPYTRVLKDYNGQTYWLSFNPLLFAKTKTKIPAWLQLSLGYSAYGMLGGHYNNVLAVDANGNVLQFDRVRRYYLSLDIDLTRIKTRSALLKKVLTAFNMLKLPAPAIEFSQKGTRFYYVYY